ncbi:MAG: replicative DNA helicase [Lachnospiraceae bacterium]
MDEAVIKKVQPNDIKAEQAVIGSMLLDRNMIVEVADILTKEDFYYSQYGLIFSAMVELYNEGKPVDLLTVSNKLKEMGAPDSVCSMEYIGETLAVVDYSGRAKDYAEIVQDKAVLRRMIQFTEATTQKCYSGKTNIKELLVNSEEELFNISKQKNSSTDFADMKDVAIKVLDTIEENARRKSKVTGIATGFIDLDEKLSGLHGSELIIIAARPAMGKTAFALNIAQYAAMRGNVPTAIFSLEMSKEQLVTRLVAMDSMVDSQSIRTGQILDGDWDKIIDSTHRVGSAPMYIDDTPGIDIADLRSKCRKLKQTKGLGLIVIDYLQLMNASGKKESRQQEINEISRSLKKLAKELEVPVIALSQLNRAADAREDHRPVMSDLRESGGIEQDADVIMFIYRDDYYNKESEKPGIAEIIVAKQRNGSTGPIELVWLGKYTKFANKERRSKKN